jgi:Methyltransferase domain
MQQLPFLNTIIDYYSQKIEEHGPTPKGVDWSGEEAQQISFTQLVKVLPECITKEITVLDYGCGYGAMSNFLNSKSRLIKYIGYDITPQMIAQAIKSNPDQTWLTKLADQMRFDYVIACGILSVKQNVDEEVWKKHVLETLNQLNKLSKKGFAFNSLTTFSDKEKMKDYLYYANPMELFEYCKTKFSGRVALLHDYPKYEFTILVRKE